MLEAVRLKLAREEFFAGGGFSGTFVPVSVAVKNLAFTKDVAILYSPDGHVWKEASLAFASHLGDHDLFAGTINEQVSGFAVRYSVAGATFFDNNAGHDYGFGPPLAVVGGNVVLDSATARRGTQAGGGFVFTTSWLEGTVLVNNLGFAKNVGVRLSADGGLTWQDTNAGFSGAHTHGGIFVGPGAEVWRFKTPELNLDPSSAEFRFAVFYDDVSSGRTFWDNNFGADYRISKADGAIIE